MVSFMIKLYALALCGFLASCAFTKPFWRPKASTLPSAGGVGVITHAVLHNDKRCLFDDYTKEIISALEAGKHPGLLGFSLRFQVLGNEVWTMTAWVDETSMRNFVKSPLHRVAIASAGRAIKSMQVRQFPMDHTQFPPNWESAMEALSKPEGQSHE